MHYFKFNIIDYWLCTGKTLIHSLERRWSLDADTAAEHPSPAGLSTMHGENLDDHQKIWHL
jgi:hypothetical protein